MASLAYFPLYPKDFLGATGRLNAEKFGIYTRLLFTSWFEPLDNDLGELAFIAGSNENLTKQVLDRYFVLNDDVWVNQRLEKERKSANDKHQKAVESGKKGAEKRWGDDSNPNSPPIGDPNGNANSRDLSKQHSKTIATHNSELRPKNIEPISQSVLGAHTAFINISTKKPTNHELLQLTNLCHEYTPIVIIEAISVMGDHGWHSIGTLKKVLKGELPEKDKKKKEIDERFVV